MPLLINDLGVVAKTRQEIPGSLAAISLREKSWSHRLIDQNNFLQKHLIKVSCLPPKFQLYASFSTLSGDPTYSGTLSYEMLGS